MTWSYFDMHVTVFVFNLGPKSGHRDKGDGLKILLIRFRWKISLQEKAQAQRRGDAGTVTLKPDTGLRWKRLSGAVVVAVELRCSTEEYKKKAWVRKR